MNSSLLGIAQISVTGKEHTFTYAYPFYATKMLSDDTLKALLVTRGAIRPQDEITSVSYLSVNIVPDASKLLGA